MSLALRHRDRVLARSAPAAVLDPMGGGIAAAVPAATRAEGTAAAQIRLRLVHDLRRLKEIQSLERKVAAKREMLPEYAPWVAGLLERARETGTAVAEPVLPTVMVWRIDTGDWDGALDLAEHVIRHRLPLPERYKRTPGTLVLEEIANAAIVRLGAGEPFAPAVLERVAALTEDQDMPDEVRAKLHKAMGMALMPDALAGNAAAAAEALAQFRRARTLHDRIGVADKIKRLEKLTAAADGGE